MTWGGELDWFPNRCWLQRVTIRAIPNPQDVNRGPGLVTMFSNSVPFQANNWLPNCWSLELSKMRLLIYPSGRKGGATPKNGSVPIPSRGTEKWFCQKLWPKVSLLMARSNGPFSLPYWPLYGDYIFELRLGVRQSRSLYGFLYLNVLYPAQDMPDAFLMHFNLY
jgi:hypothetical protein